MHPNLLFTFLSLCNFISSISLAIVAPFFPPFAKDRGIDEDLIGLIFSAHPLGAALAALLVGKKLRNVLLILEYRKIVKPLWLAA